MKNKHETEIISHVMFIWFRTCMNVEYSEGCLNMNMWLFDLEHMI